MDVDVRLDNESNIIVYGTFEDTYLSMMWFFTFLADDGVNLFLIKMDGEFNSYGEYYISLYQESVKGWPFQKDNYYYLSANRYAHGSDTVSRIAYY